MEADRASTTDGRARCEAGRRAARHQRDRPCVEKRLPRWCDCAAEYGPPMTIYNRFVRWARRGIWENVFRDLAGNGRSTDTQMIDSTQVKAHRSVAGGALQVLVAQKQFLVHGVGDAGQDTCPLHKFSALRHQSAVSALNPHKMVADHWR